MHHRLLFFFFLLSVATVVARAQTLQFKKSYPGVNTEKSIAAGIRTCGTEDYLNKNKANDPLLSNKYDEMRRFMSRYISAHEAALINGKTVYQIPVVVHVVYRNSTENISDSQIYSQLDVLNNDYRRQNSDAAQTPAVWSSIAADAEISFCLAQTDPQGQSTSGITRTFSSQSSFNISNDNVKFSSNGGHNVWNPDKYLNLWVCNLDGTLLGYAQFPNGGSPTTDGVVIDYQYFGTTGTATPPFNKGRTATHEIGHWLGLLHIWGDEPACGFDDNVSDTPQQLDKNYGCPTYPNTSGSGAACSGSNQYGSMFMNYMDYSDDDCMNLFTNGQKAVMVTALTQIRASLLSSNACSPAGPSCDSLNNFANSDTPSLFTPSGVGSGGTGYISGTNSYNDKAKADKFFFSSTSYDIRGVWINFGYIYATSGSNTYTAKVWDDNGPGGLPGTTLTSQQVTAQTIYNNLLNGNPTYVAFPFEPNHVGSFYTGLEFDPTTGDSLAIITNMPGEPLVNTAYELWSDNTWHAYNESSSWNISLNHDISPRVCINTGTKNLEMANFNTLAIYPNPVNQLLWFTISNSNPINNCNIRIIDFTGKILYVSAMTVESGKTLSIPLDGLNSGMYFLEVSSDVYFSKGKFTVVK